jgi:hypothetical protein
MIKAIQKNQMYSKPTDSLSTEEKARMFDEKNNGDR